MKSNIPLKFSVSPIKDLAYCFSFCIKETQQPPAIQENTKLYKRMDLKNLNIGLMIKEKVTRNGIEMARICKFFNCQEEKILNMYNSSSLDTALLLRWSKLLEYDFFRLYSQHLILYAPQSSMDYVQKKKIPDSLPVFRKSLYTKEIIEFVLDKIRNGEMTKSKVISEYKIPKSTLYKWLHKYSLMEK